MYRPSPVRNQRSRGIKIKHVLQVCLLLAVCFWLIFQIKRSHDKKKEFDANDSKISSSTSTRSNDEIAKFGRKDLQPKLKEPIKKVENHEEVQEHEQEEEEDQEEHEGNKHEEEEQDEDKIEEEKDDRGGGGDDEIDENEQDKLDMEIDREEVDTIDEENEEKDGQSRTENGVSSDDHDEDVSTVHTHEAREEHYKADDASSAVTHDGRILGTENENKNATLDNPSENLGLNISMNQETGFLNATSSLDSHENGPPANTKLITSNSTEPQNVTVIMEQLIANATEGSLNSTYISEVESDSDEVEHDAIDSTDSSHLEEKEVRTDLDTLPEIETEGGNSEDTAAE